MLIEKIGSDSITSADYIFQGEIEYQLDVNPWSDQHSDAELWDAFVDPFGVLQIARYDEPEGVRAIWAFNAHLLGTGLAATIWGSEWAAYRMLMMPVTITAVAGPYVATNVIHHGHSTVARSLPEHEQKGFWQSVGSALGGNLGVGSAVQL